MTTLDAQFMRAVVLLCGFKPKPMVRAQAGLLLIGLQGGDFTAASLPAELGGKHLSGAATGALVSTGLLTVVGRMKSPNPDAKGRKLDILRITSRETARAWLRANDVSEPLPVETPQAAELALAFATLG